eukprot:CAMPEP_0181498740 /NCGR_PEP_ID=MMETSP1110-20121109/54265_1 /TAXON_ID=174948 /ORGANISM="Symbiodinium sp., Strain CCMP421" /LENGTH=151 /DNA_ID=CAMNT_0023626837 /DNA_START=29 /DNA_END=484 /DNA_ORIENTATION=-
MKNMMVSVSDILRRQGRLQAQHDRTKDIVLAIFGNSISASKLVSKSQTSDHSEVDGFALPTLPKRKTVQAQEDEKPEVAHDTGEVPSLRHSFSLRTETLEDEEELDPGFRRSSTHTLEDIAWKDPVQPEVPAGFPPPRPGSPAERAAGFPR